MFLVNRRAMSKIQNYADKFLSAYDQFSKTSEKTVKVRSKLFSIFDYLKKMHANLKFES